MIPIPVYVGRRFMVTVEGTAWQPVECEHCHLEWAFRVRTAGIGMGESPYMMDDKAAKERATKRARIALEADQRLASEGVTRNVACPGCGKYQRDMVTSLRAGHGSSWGALGVAGILVGCLLVLRGLTGSGSAAGVAAVWLACGALPIVGGLASLAWRRRLQSRFDPNANAAPPAPIAPTQPYRQLEKAAGRGGREPSEAPEVVTRGQYEAACAEALAHGAAAPPPLRWKTG